MSPRSFAVLALATAASVGLAAYAVQERDLPVRSAAAGGAMFPDLLDRLNDIREVDIVGPEGKLTIVPKDQGWVLQEKAGYPVDPAQLRTLGLAVANLQLVEAKTADPQRLPRLELSDPGTADAKSHLVDIKGADGEALAAVVVGKSSPSLYGSGHGGVYVRRAGDNQAWLAAGELEVPSDAMALIGQDVVDVPADQIARVVLQPADGPAITLSRPDANAAFTVDAGLPEGRKLDPVKVEFLTGSLAGLTMTDVRPAGELATPNEQHGLRFETFDGVPVDVQVSTIGEGDAAQNWLTLDTSAPPAGVAAEPAQGEDGAKPAATLADRVRKLEGWAYEVPSYLADRLKGGLDQLLAEPTPAS